MGINRSMYFLFHVGGGERGSEVKCCVVQWNLSIKITLGTV